jgi:hypothetical protein
VAAGAVTLRVARKEAKRTAQTAATAKNHKGKDRQHAAVGQGCRIRRHFLPDEARHRNRRNLQRRRQPPEPGLHFRSQRRECHSQCELAYAADPRLRSTAISIGCGGANDFSYDNHVACDSRGASNVNHGRWPMRAAWLNRHLQGVNTSVVWLD